MSSVPPTLRRRGLADVTKAVRHASYIDLGRECYGTNREEHELSALRIAAIDSSRVAAALSAPLALLLDAWGGRLGVAVT